MQTTATKPSATSQTTPDEVTSFTIEREVEIAAPADAVWESILAQLGPESEMPDGKPFPMKLEPWPGGRWFRDLGDNTGHFWGHVQVIKPPPHPKPLLEICGPMFMSYPAASHLQYRLIPEGERTRLRLTHRAMGTIPEEHSRSVHQGWEFKLNRIRQAAEERGSARAKRR